VYFGRLKLTKITCGFSTTITSALKYF